MTVAELIEWLKTKDQEAEVQVMLPDESQHWSGTTYSWHDFTGSDFQYDYVDLRGNQFVSPDMPHYDRRFLYFGVLG